MKSFKLQQKGDSDENQEVGVTGIISGIIILASIAWFFLGGGIEIQTTNTLDDIHQQVVLDTIQQYQITKRSGNKIDICVHAGLVSASYLQAKDEVNYQHWKNIERSDCVDAGMPEQYY